MTLHRLLAVLTPERCTGCGRCIAACAPQLFHFETHSWRKRVVLERLADCTGCSLCAQRCPTGALRMQRVTHQPLDKRRDGS
jgi:NAD-dependent dihydropyrimidine dehydrogenase PreA subunit